VSGLDDIKNKAQEVLGEAKEKIGSATGNKDLEAEGHKDQAGAQVKDAGQKIKDALTD
jgi:uncharacterized protein YjbJ (UPF0337 family)